MPERPFDVVTFDCYGTLIDWETGIAAAFLRAAAENGVSLERDAVLHAYEAIEPIVEQERYRPYAEVLTETAYRVARSLGWPLAPERGSFLPASLRDWTPFPDTNPALERLKRAGYRLGILSNVDDDLLAATLRHFTVAFDVIVTAQQVRSYKPAPAHLLTARGRLVGARWVHAAQSNFHDIVPANALGIPTAWVNRRGDAALAGGVPTVAEVRTLADLLV
jgi:2-haloacid dehalogenase/putative hydrolase of the HAD superfamily